MGTASYGGGAWRLGTLTSVFYSSEMSSQRKGRVKPPQSLNIGVFNVCGYSTNEVKKGEIGKMFLRRRFDLDALSDTKLKGKAEVMFGEVVGRVSGVEGGRAREGMGPVTEWVVDEVCGRIEAGIIQASVG